MSATGNNNKKGLTCPPDVDEEVFSSLPLDMQQEIVNQHAIDINNNSSSDSEIECLGVSTNNSKLPDVNTMKIKDIKRELESYDISTSLMIEKDELVTALIDARKKGLRAVKLLGSNNNGISNGMSDYRAAARKRYMESQSRQAVVQQKQSDTNSNNGFIPYHLYAHTSAKSLPASDPTKKYFQTLRQVIGFDGSSSSRNYQWLFIFNYLVDFQYLLSELTPELIQFRRVVVFYGSKNPTEAYQQQWKQLLAGTGNTVEFIRLHPSDPPNTRTNPLPLKFSHGVHHTKCFLVGYEENGKSMCRVVVHTANLVAGDVERQTNSVYHQDFPLKQQKTTESKKPAVVNPYKRKRESSSSLFEEDDDTSQFEEDMINNLESYYYKVRQSWCHPSMSPSNNTLSSKAMSWLQLIRQYDFSRAYVVLIPSVPGRHKADSYNNFGYFKLRQAIIENVCRHRQQSTTAPKPTICQFSSMGEFSSKYLSNFLSAIDSSTTQNNDPITIHEIKSKKKQALTAKLVLPTMDEIRTSIEGYNGGGSIPFRANKVDKDFLQPLYHRWSHRNRNSTTDPFKTARHIPHNKTFLQPSSTIANGIDWLLVTSHNLSITAWGQIQMRSKESHPDEKILFIQHWELGVFMSPATLAKMAPDEVGSDIQLMPYPGIDKSAVINIDGDEEDDIDESESPKVLVPLPFDINPVPYDRHDIPWAADRRGNFPPDAFGYTMGA